MKVLDDDDDDAGTRRLEPIIENRVYARIHDNMSS
jgi:hypothetical protein